MYDIIGEWDKGKFFSNGVVTDFKNYPIGLWSMTGDLVSVSLKTRSGGLALYTGVFDAEKGEITGKVKDYSYTWLAKVNDPEASYFEADFVMRRING